MPHPAPRPGPSRYFFALLFFLAFIHVALPVWGAEEKDGFEFKDFPAKVDPKIVPLDRVQARACLLVDATTGKILYERNADERHLPASTVKLMTGLITFETLGFNGTVTVDPDDLKVEPSWVPLRPGETVSVDVLLHALLIYSANDSARALARKVAGSDEAFVNLMNERASQLGCTNTHYANPNGLPFPNEYSSCRDLMKVFQAVISHPELRKICSTEFYTISTQAGHKLLKNHNLLLGKYPGMGPAKTGWTVASRHTYAAACTRKMPNGQVHELILTLMDSPNKWMDIPILFNYGFATISGGAPTFAAPPGVTRTAMPGTQNIVVLTRLTPEPPQIELSAPPSSSVSAPPVNPATAHAPSE